MVSNSFLHGINVIDKGNTVLGSKIVSEVFEESIFEVGRDAPGKRRKKLAIGLKCQME